MANLCSYVLCADSRAEWLKFNHQGEAKEINVTGLRLKPGTQELRDFVRGVVYIDAINQDLSQEPRITYREADKTSWHPVVNMVEEPGCQSSIIPNAFFSLNAIGGNYGNFEDKNVEYKVKFATIVRYATKKFSYWVLVEGYGTNEFLIKDASGKVLKHYKLTAEPLTKEGTYVYMGSLGRYNMYAHI